MVNTRFWSDNFVVDHLNALDRLLFLYLLTNNKTNIIGIYELPLRTAAFETGIERDDLAKMLHRLTPKVEYFDGWVYIRRFTDHQQSNPSVEKGMMREFFELPDAILNRVKELGIDSPKLARAFAMLEQAKTDSIQTVTESDKVSVTKPKPNLNSTKPNLTKPTDSNTTATKKVASKHIDLLFEKWEELVGYKLTSQVKANREYAAKLLKEYTLEDVERMLQGVAMSHADQYAPRIANFVQLHRKWDDLKAWGARQARSTASKQSRGSTKV